MRLKKSIYDLHDYRSCNYSGSWTKHFINEYVDTFLKTGIVNTENRLYCCKKEHLPNHLYKFYSTSVYNIISFENETVYLSSPRSFNDPFDSYVCIERETYIKTKVLNFIKTNNLISEFESDSFEKLTSEEFYTLYNSWSKEDYQKNTASFHPSFNTVLFQISQTKSATLRRQIRSIYIDAGTECDLKIDHIRNMHFRISCFSNFKDENLLNENTTMWSHYAENHRGFCVRYKINSNSKEYRTQLCGLFPITYSSKISKIPPRELLKVEIKNDKLDLTRNLLKTSYKALTTKSRFWNYENEWRLIIPEDNKDKLTNSSIKFFPIDKIYLGANIQESLKRYLIQICEKKDIPIIQMSLSNEGFKLTQRYTDSGIVKDQNFYKKLKMINEIENDHDRNKKREDLLREDYY